MQPGWTSWYVRDFHPRFHPPMHYERAYAEARSFYLMELLRQDSGLMRFHAVADAVARTDCVRRALAK